MAGQAVTKIVKDGNGDNLIMRLWDESDSGVGPFSFYPWVVGTPADARETNPDSPVTTFMALIRAGFFTGEQILSFLQALATGETVPVSQSSSELYIGSNAVVPKYALIAAAANGDNQIVAAVAAKKIRVLSYNFIANGAVNAKFQSGAAGTDLTGLKYCPEAGDGIAVGYAAVGWFETVAGQALNLRLSAATAVGGELVYIEV